MNTRNINFPSNKVHDIEKTFMEQLSALYLGGETRQFVNMLFESFMGWDLKDILLNRNSTIDQSTLLKFHWALEDLKLMRPIQHIIGYSTFCDCRIEVNSEVLIPRPETEEIVIRTIAQLQKTNLTILDVCTGSGCIAIGLAKRIPDARVWAVDISESALGIAKSNAVQNNVDIQFCQVDILHELEKLPSEQFDLIISNPPYIRTSEASVMHSNVLDYEPHLALFVDDSDPLVFYARIAEYAKNHLAPGGLLVFEINEFLAFETNQMLQTKGFETKGYPDFREKERSIVAWKK